MLTNAITNIVSDSFYHTFSNGVSDAFTFRYVNFHWYSFTFAKFNRHIVAVAIALTIFVVDVISECVCNGYKDAE